MSNQPMIQFKKATPGATIPKRQSAGAAGFDLHSVDTVDVTFGDKVMVSTGIEVAIPPGYVGLVKPRSGLAFRDGIDTMAGVIDSDYRGVINVILTKHSTGVARLIKNERIAQLVVVPMLGDAVEVQILDDTERGAGGFGSTGK